MTKPTFEDALAFIENRMGIQLYEYQKKILQVIYDNPHSHFMLYGRSGNTVTAKAVSLLNEYKGE